MNKVSIIIPIYNGEKYIERCIKSVVNSTYSDLEIIIVNDGSKDNTDEIIKKWLFIENRIKYIVQENKGVSEARNAGINASTGKYIMFVDCDDWIDHKMVEHLITKCIAGNYDLVTTGRIVYENNKIIETSIPTTKPIYDNKSIMREILDGNRVHWISICDKLFVANIVKSYNIYFDKKLKYAEDTEFLYQYLIHTNRVSFVSEALYHHPIYLDYKKIDHYQLNDVEYTWKNHFIIYNQFEKMFKATGAFNDYKTKIYSKLIGEIRGLLHSNFRYRAKLVDVYSNFKKYYIIWGKRIDNTTTNQINGIENQFVYFCLKHRNILLLCFVEKVLVGIKRIMGNY